jgi:hypothetical protein
MAKGSARRAAVVGADADPDVNIDADAEMEVDRHADGDGKEGERTHGWIGTEDPV